MSEKKEKPLKYCVYCGAKAESQVYCPNCGKQIITVKTDQEKFQESRVHEAILPQVQAKISRKCSGCGSIITSSILDQCPICNAVLEPLPEYQKLGKTQPGFIFTEKKLQLEIRKNIWNLREGIQVFKISIIIYIFIYIGVTFFIYYNFYQGNTGGTSTSEINMYILLLVQIPGIFFSIFPLRYILLNKHQFKKLGFSSDSTKLVLAFVIGLIGGFLLLLINFICNFINDLFLSLGFTLFDNSELIAEERSILRQANSFLLIVFMILIILQSISIEILFRGVLHNTLAQKFKKSEGNFIPNFKIILIVALVFCGIYFLFNWLIIIYLLILNLLFFILLEFLFFILLGILYEINRNIYNTIIANITYNIILIILILFV